MSTDENGAPTTVSAAGQEKTVAIFIKFARNPSDPRTDGNAALVNYVQDESVSFQVVQSAQAPLGTSVPPPLRSDQLLLADIKLIFGQTQVLNADISQARREDFSLRLTHGGTHLELGTDPIPNATETNGGLESAVDKIKLNRLPLTAAGLAVLFPTQGAPYQATNVVAPSATTLDVSTQMLGQQAGGASLKEGIVTQSAAPANRVQLLNEDNDEFKDPAGNEIFGRLTVNSEGGSTTIAAGSNALALPLNTINVVSTASFPSSGQLYIVSLDGVQTITYTGKTGTSFTGCTGGTGLLLTGNQVHQVGGPTTWTLGFWIFDPGTNTEVAYDFTPHVGATIKWWVKRTYYLHNLPTFSQSGDFIPSDQVAGDMPDATTTVKGKVLLAPDGGTTVGTVVQANDSRLASIGSGNLPIGGICMWQAPTAGTPMPSAPAGFEYCDGGNVSTVGSILLGKAKPALMKTSLGPNTTLRVARGHDGQSGSYGGAVAFVQGGSDTHAHTVNSHNHGGGVGFSGTTGGESGHTHSIPSYSHKHSLNTGDVGGSFNANSPGNYSSQDSHDHGGTGGSTGHTHSFSASAGISSDAPPTDSQPNIPNFVALAFIVRVL